MTKETKSTDDLEAGERQSDATTEANKPDEARAKGKPDSGNILGGVQPKD